jgi:23S rRNA (adenine2503-C2)-methyltransferase
MMDWKNINVFEDEKEHVKKYVFEKDDIAIESVLYRYPTYDERTVLCISTMCGCPMGCRFCGTGDYFVRNLTADEIVGQAEYILETQIGGLNPKDIKKLQIMVMSMGEPALNKNLEEAFEILYKKYPNAALLISSSGPKVSYQWIIDMSKRIPTVGLQFSIHESTDEARDKLIPFDKKLNLQEIADVGVRWYLDTGRKPYFNYCAHEGNNKYEDVSRLLKLFHPAIWNATVSVICERDSHAEATNDVQRELAIEFGNKLVANDYDVRVFDPAGQDTIGGGCGQLWYVQDWMKDHPEYVKPSIGCGLQKVHTPKEWQLCK